MRWPSCFYVYEERRKPLKVGIHTDILAAGGFEERALRAALRVYVLNPRYWDRLIAGAERIGLDGVPAGTVTAEEAEDAAEKNAAYFKRARQARRAATPRLQERGVIPRAAPTPAPRAQGRWPLLTLPLQRRN